MKECPTADALTSIGAALDWDVDAGLRHVINCDDCGQQLRVLQLTHESMTKSEEVGADVVAKISHLITAEAAHERARDARKQNLGKAIEALLAGITAVAIGNGGGGGLSSGVSVAVFAMAATAVLAYRVLFSSQATASRSSAPSIQ